MKNNKIFGDFDFMIGIFDHDVLFLNIKKLDTIYQSILLNYKKIDERFFLN